MNQFSVYLVDQLLFGYPSNVQLCFWSVFKLPITFIAEHLLLETQAHMRSIKRFMASGIEKAYVHY